MNILELAERNQQTDYKLLDDTGIMTDTLSWLP